MRFLRILFCSHKTTVLRWADGKMYVSCLDCPFDSPGVRMGQLGVNEPIGAARVPTTSANGILREV